MIRVIIFLFSSITILQASSLPIALVKNRAAQAIVLNATAIKAQSVARVKNLNIPFTTWLQFRKQVIDNKEYCPDNHLKIQVGSQRWLLWVNELGVWALFHDEAMPLAPHERRPSCLLSFSRGLRPDLGIVLTIDQEKIQLQCIK